MIIIQNLYISKPYYKKSENKENQPKDIYFFIFMYKKLMSETYKKNGGMMDIQCHLTTQLWNELPMNLKKKATAHAFNSL